MLRRWSFHLYLRATRFSTRFASNTILIWRVDLVEGVEGIWVRIVCKERGLDGVEVVLGSGVSYREENVGVKRSWFPRDLRLAFSSTDSSSKTEDMIIAFFLFFSNFWDSFSRGKKNWGIFWPKAYILRYYWIIFLLSSSNIGANKSLTKTRVSWDPLDYRKNLWTSLPGFMKSFATMSFILMAFWMLNTDAEDDTMCSSYFL